MESIYFSNCLCVIYIWFSLDKPLKQHGKTIAIFQYWSVLITQTANYCVQTAKYSMYFDRIPNIEAKRNS